MKSFIINKDNFVCTSSSSRACLQTSVAIQLNNYFPGLPRRSCALLAMTLSLYLLFVIYMKAQCQKFLKSTCGATMVEFAVILPLLLSLLIGVVEISSYVFAFNKTEKTASSLAAIIARGDLTAAQLDDLLQATDPLMTPFDFTSTDNGVIVTMWRANATSGVPEVLWTRSYRTPGTAMTPATLASKITLNKDTGETVMTIEVFYKFIPMLVGAVFPSGTADVYSAAFAFPRDGSMDTLL